MFKANKYHLMNVIIILLLTFTGCSTSTSTMTGNEENTDETSIDADVSSNNDESTSDNTSQVNYPITITHAYGETIIEEKPERIATIGWGNQDIPLALGIVPVGMSTVNYGNVEGTGLLPWTKDALDSLNVTDPNLYNDLTSLDFEAISDSDPDVILAAYSGITEEEYNLLSEIAPVVAYPDKAWQTSWQDQILYNAKGMGMEAQGQTLVSDLENLIEDKLDDYPSVSGKTVGFLYIDPADFSSFYIYLPSDPRTAYLLDLGMTFPQNILDLDEANDSFSLHLSSENIDILQDLDIIILYGSEGIVGQLQADSLWGQVPAIQKGAIANIIDGSSLAASGTPSALSIPATIDEYLDIINQAAEKSE